MMIPKTSATPWLFAVGIAPDRFSEWREDVGRPRRPSGPVWSLHWQY
jgi:hypothetical protein